MTDTVFFMNQSEFDKDAMLTFGVSAKDDDTAIGYFGTGFKYATAIILRIGGSIVVRSKGNVYEFKSTKKIIKNQEFDTSIISLKTSYIHQAAKWVILYFAHLITPPELLAMKLIGRILMSLIR